jgi:two-component system nitrogen regulation response regulator GlnG
VIETKDLPPEVLQAAEPDASAPAQALALPVAAMPSGVAESTAPEAIAVAKPSAWEGDLESEALALLESGRTDVWDVLTQRFETRLIQAALFNSRGRRIEAAQKLGIGRNTITRKIQELGIED